MSISDLANWLSIIGFAVSIGTILLTWRVSKRVGKLRTEMYLMTRVPELIQTISSLKSEIISARPDVSSDQGREAIRLLVIRTIPVLKAVSLRYSREKEIISAIGLGQALVLNPKNRISSWLNLRLGRLVELDQNSVFRFYESLVMIEETLKVKLKDQEKEIRG